MTPHERYVYLQNIRAMNEFRSDPVPEFPTVSPAIVALVSLVVVAVILERFFPQ